MDPILTPPYQNNLYPDIPVAHLKGLESFYHNTDSGFLSAQEAANIENYYTGAYARRLCPCVSDPKKLCPCETTEIIDFVELTITNQDDVPIQEVFPEQIPGTNFWRHNVYLFKRPDGSNYLGNNSNISFEIKIYKPGFSTPLVIPILSSEMLEK